MSNHRLLFGVLLIAVVLLSSCKEAEPPAPDLKDGDIVFQDFPSPQSAAVKLATQSEYSHCGIVFMENGQPMVWEAVQPVCITPLDEWVARDTSRHYVVKRIIGADTLLTPAVLDSMKAIGMSFMGFDYDIYFAWSDEQLYCSEFVWKLCSGGIGVELAPLRAMGEYDLSHPAVQQVMAQRWGEDFPAEEPVVSPQDLFDSGLLELVVEVMPE